MTTKSDGGTAVADYRPKNEIASFEADLMRGRDKRIAPLLPPHIDPDNFIGVVINAIRREPLLLQCNRDSLFQAAMRAAEDQLLPNGVQGAIVPYKGQAQWMPMVRGLLDLLYRTTQAQSIDVQAVYDTDRFSYRAGDDPYIEHIPDLDGPRDAPSARYFYAIIRMVNGGIYREVMNRREVEAIQAISQAKNGPWKSHWVQMALKTVLRRCLKRVPGSDHVIRVLDRENNAILHATVEPPAPRPTLSDRVQPQARIIDAGAAVAGFTEAALEDASRHADEPPPEAPPPDEPEKPKSLQDRLGAALQGASTPEEVDAVGESFRAEARKAKSERALRNACAARREELTPAAPAEAAK